MMKENTLAKNKFKRSRMRWIIITVSFVIFLLVAYLITSSIFSSSLASQSENTHDPSPLILLYLSENENHKQIHQYDVTSGLNHEIKIHLPEGESPDTIVWRDKEHILFISQDQGFIELNLKSGEMLSFNSYTKTSFFSRGRLVSSIGSLDWCPEIRRIVVSGSGFSPDFGWVEILDSSGKMIERVSDRSGYTDVACSPNGSSVAVVDTIQTSGMTSFSHPQNNPPLKISEEKDIYLTIMTLDNGETTQLTNHGFAIQPNWSPDGSQIAFVGRFVTDTSGTQIYVFDLDSEERQALTAFEEGNLASPTWSPDGKMIAFVKDGDIWLLQVETRELMQLTHTPEEESAPVWHP